MFSQPLVEQVAVNHIRQAINEPIGVIGIAWFRESINLPKMVGLVLIVVGVILLNLKGAG